MHKHYLNWCGLTNISKIKYHVMEKLPMCGQGFSDDFQLENIYIFMIKNCH